AGGTRRRAAPSRVPLASVLLWRSRHPRALPSSPTRRSSELLSPHTADLDVGMPARGLHGEAYRGHVFWDELFVFPFLNTRNTCRSEEHTSELQSRENLVCRLRLERKKRWRSGTPRRPSRPAG